MSYTHTKVVNSALLSMWQDDTRVVSPEKTNFILLSTFKGLIAFKSSLSFTAVLQLPTYQISFKSNQRFSCESLRYTERLSYLY